MDGVPTSNDMDGSEASNDLDHTMSTLRHDADDKRRYTMDFTPLLASGDTLSNVACAVVAGVATISASSSSGATTCTAVTSSPYATIWVLSADEGTVKVRFRATTSAGERLDVTGTLMVEQC